MFNRVAIPQYNHLLMFLGKRRRIGEYYVREIEWLREQGIVFEPERGKHDPTLWSDEEFKRFFELEFERQRKMREEIDNEVDAALKDGIAPDSYVGDERARNIIQSLITGLGDTAEYHVRQISIQLRKLDNLQAYPVLLNSMQPLQEPQATKNDVVHIVLKALPIPDEATPWEQIIEFRADTDSSKKFLALRNWINEIARAKLPPSEVEEKFEYLINEYRDHMKLHKLKVNKGALETIVVASAEFLEDMVRIKWGKIAKGLFAFKHKKIALMEGELSAPGREIAYVVKAKDEFS